jgi:hypothetical protein
MPEFPAVASIASRVALHRRWQFVCPTQKSHTDIVSLISGISGGYIRATAASGNRFPLLTAPIFH